MAILNVIEFFDETGEIMICKTPQEGAGEFRLGSQLVVQESQIAVFYKDGKALDGFRAGRHTLVTQNLPLLGSLIGAPFGGKSPFRCYLYFVSTKTFHNLGWGTPTPVLFRDTDLRMVSLRAHGSCSIRVVKARTFLNTIVGTRGIETTYAIQEFLRSIIVARLNEVLGSAMKSILDLPAQYNNIALSVKDAVEHDLGQYGIQLVDLFVEAITVPPEVQEMINRAGGVAAQDVEKYKGVAAADAMRDAAKNPSGIAGQGIGAGLGLGVGFGVAKEFTRAFGSPEAPPAQSPPSSSEAPGGPGAARLTAEELRTKLKNLKELKEADLITDSDFEEQKRRLLSQL